MQQGVTRVGGSDIVGVLSSDLGVFALTQGLAAREPVRDAVRLLK
jgi:hypothetical protein